jgi:hypothetical protein
MRLEARSAGSEHAWPRGDKSPFHRPRVNRSPETLGLKNERRAPRVPAMAADTRTAHLCRSPAALWIGPRDFPRENGGGRR